MPDSTINYSDLSENQLKAVQTIKGYVRVIAGAGSGKTRALTYRYAYLADELGVSTSAIAAITFTTKAANEMKKRVRDMLGDVDTGYICTFHGLGNKILKKEISRIGWPLKYDIIDGDQERERILSVIYKNLGITIRDFTYEKAETAITTYKHRKRDEYVDFFAAPSEADFVPAEEEEETESVSLQQIVYEYLAYQKRLKKIDYDDMVCIPLYLFDRHKDMYKEWSEKFSYVMVDEFQDVSESNYELCKIISSYCKNLFIVGDPDQTIYSFRGANINYILEFDTVYRPLTDISFMLNRRSQEGIVNAANQLIRKNQQRKDLPMEVHRHSPVKAKYYHAQTKKEETDFVVSEIKRLLESGVHGGEIAILYRMHKQANRFVELLDRRNISYILHDKELFYERKEIAALVNYVKLLVNPSDNEAFEEAIQWPPRGIGSLAIGELYQYAIERKISLYDALKTQVEDGTYSIEEAADFISFMDEIRSRYHTMQVNEVLSEVAARSGIEDLLRTYSRGERLSSLSELINRVNDRETQSADPYTLDMFLAEAELEVKQEKENRINLMTVHAAKGLEFDYVFVVGMNEGIFPSSNVHTLIQMEEERRLAYVAFTRAKEELFITESEKESTASKYITHPSRFIFNTSLDLLEEISAHPLSADAKANALSYIAVKENELHNEERVQALQERFFPGQSVSHAVYGIGTVMEVRSDSAVVVLFPDGKIPIGKPSVLTPCDDPTISEDETDEEEPQVEIIRTEEEPNDAAKDTAILEFLNETIADREYADKVSVLPLMPGTGKSHAISQKIREVIMNLDEEGAGDGIVIVTDNIKRMNEYLVSEDPLYDPELYGFLAQNKQYISVMHYENFKEESKRAPYCPVLIISTQHYFNRTIEEINGYLQWEKGRRTVIIFDEQPYIRNIVELKRQDINDIVSAFTDGIPDTAGSDMKKWCIERIEEWRRILNAAYDKMESAYKGTARHYLYFPSLDEGEKTDNEIACVLEFAEKNRNQINLFRGGEVRNVYPKLKALCEILTIGGVFAFRSGSTGSYSSALYTLTDNRQLLKPRDAKVIIMDGTASPQMPDYKRGYWGDIFHFCDCEQFKRQLSNLTIKLIDEASGANTIMRDETSRERILAKVMEEIMKDSDGSMPVCFSYQDMMDYLSNYFPKDMMNYFGNIKGKNDYRNANQIVQIGLFRWPDVCYFLYELDKDINLRFKLQAASYSFLNGDNVPDQEDPSQTISIEMKSRNTKTRETLRQLLLADIEQNMMRGSIRNANSKKPFTFYLVLSFGEYGDLIKELKKRYGAKKVIPIEKTEEEKRRKVMERAVNEDTVPQRFLKWHDTLSAGTLYTTKEIRENIGLKSSAKLKDYYKDNSAMEDILKNERISRGNYQKK